MINIVTVDVCAFFRHYSVFSPIPQCPGSSPYGYAYPSLRITALVCRFLASAEKDNSVELHGSKHWQSATANVKKMHLLSSQTLDVSYTFQDYISYLYVMIVSSHVICISQKALSCSKVSNCATDSLGSITCMGFCKLCTF